MEGNVLIEWQPLMTLIILISLSMWNDGTNFIECPLMNAYYDLCNLLKSWSIIASHEYK